MNNKKIKVFIHNLVSDYIDLEHYFPLTIFLKNFNAKIVNNPLEADVIFEMIAHDGKSFLNEKNKIVILVSAENLFMRRNLFNWIERAVRIFVGNEKKYKIMDKLNSIIPYFIQNIPISYCFSRHIKFIKEIDKRDNCYAILCNKEVKNKKIFNYPCFMADFYHRMPEFIKNDKEATLKDKKFCAFIASNNSARERVEFFKKLSRYKKIDSYGRVMNNMGRDFSKYWKDNYKLFKNYKFVICFENCFVDDFVTEKLPNVMLSGPIPIYRGPQNVRDYFDTASFVNYDDYGSYGKMIEKVIELDNDEQKYKEFLKRPWLHKNEISREIIEKEGKLIEFYRGVLKEHSRIDNTSFENQE